MGLQIVLCMETDNHSGTDWVYIDETINKYYVLSNEITLSRVFLKGKGNYKTAGTLKKLKDLTKKYSPYGESVVVYCIDTDDMQTNPEQKKEFDTIKEYCSSQGYGFAWFCRDVEEVYWGKRIPQSEKKRYASNFRNSGRINVIDPKQLGFSTVSISRSNLLSVLDQYLERK